jgi:hypothetical protein
MISRSKFAVGLFLFITLAILGAGSGLAVDKKGAAPGAAQTQQGQTLSVPLACRRGSGTCSCSDVQDCKDLKALKVCDGDLDCQGTAGTNNYSCSCKYKAPQ